jgi:hypothetical protein
MPAGSVSQNIASQIEYIRKDLEELVLLQGVLRKRISKSTDIKAISNRPARIPFNVLTGGLFRTGAALFDGNDMGRGSAPAQTFGNLSAIPFVQASEYTSLSEFSTDSAEKAIEDYVTLTNRQATETYAGYMDALYANSTGANDLDTVVSVSGNEIVVNNADIFQDNQIVDIWTAIGGTFLGSWQIQSIDSSNTALWGTVAPPVGTVAGCVLMVTGSSGQANSGLPGILSYHVGTNTGNFMGIPRSAFPGKFATPYVSPGGAAATGPLTPANVRAMLNQMKLAMGADTDETEFVVHGNVDTQAAWENNALPVQTIIYNELKGDNSADMLKKNMPTAIAGREFLLNVRAKPGRLDGLNLKHWFRLETKALDLHEVGGQTLFPIYGASGGLNSSQIFYYEAMETLGLGQPRRDCYMPTITIPPRYFGH